MARTVRQVMMHQKFKSVSPDATVVEAARIMKEGRVGSILVMRDGELQGIFTERDALFRVVAGRIDPAGTTVAEVMTGELVTISPDDDITHALRLMRDIGFRHLPVVESGGDIVGIVSTRDIIAATEFSILAGSVG